MQYLLLVSHGGLAEGLKDSLAMFSGHNNDDQVLALGLKDGQTVDQFHSEATQLLTVLKADDSVLVLADIVGGSPLTTVCSALDNLGKLGSTTVLGGMNLTMALTALVMKDSLQGGALAEAVLSEASSALQEFSLTSDQEEADDEI